MPTSLFGVGEVINAYTAGTIVPQSFFGTAGQTLFVLTNFQYSPNTASIQVYINGSLQTSGRDYTETSSISFTLVEGVKLGDFVDVIGLPRTTTDSTTPGAILVGGTYSLAQYLNDSVINVKAYPYLATGTGADDWASIQAAITAAGPGGTLYFPPGFYGISNTLNFLAGQQIYGGGWYAKAGIIAPQAGSIIVFLPDEDIPALQFIGDASDPTAPSFHSIAVTNGNGQGSAIGTGIKCINGNFATWHNVHVSSFATNIEQGNNCWNWSMVGVRSYDSSACLFAHDEGEDSVYTVCSFRSYRATGFCVHLKNQSQTNKFDGCDLSAGQWLAYLEQGDSNGNGTGLPLPMHASFNNCQFEDAINAAIALVTSNQNADKGLHPAVTVSHCRAFISGTGFIPAQPNSGQAFLYATHYSFVDMQSVLSNGYSYGMITGQAAYGGFVTGTLCGFAKWGLDIGSTWGTQAILGSLNNVIFNPGVRIAEVYHSAALNYVATNFTAIPFTTKIFDPYSIYNTGSAHHIPVRNLPHRFRVQLGVTPGVAGRYVVNVSKNGGASTFNAIDVTVTGTNNLILSGEIYDTPNGTTDFYTFTLFSTVNITVDTNNTVLLIEAIGN